MWLLQCLLFLATLPFLLATKAAVASEIASNAAETLSKHNGENKQLENTHQNIMKKPDPLISQSNGKEAIEALKALNAKEVHFEALQGFNGINEFQPSGWKIEAIRDNSVKEMKGESQTATRWPMGVGIALMNGCFGSNYKPGDPCYDFARMSPLCINKLEASNFIGVGFDGRGLYSSESRKQSIIQKICSKKKKFLGKALPDCMNAFGIYDYTIRTETFQDASQYVKYLQEKAATSQQQAMFQMEAKSLSQGKSVGGNFGMIGSLIGMAAGAAVGAKKGGAKGAKAGADAGGKLGGAIGQSASFGSGSGSGKSNIKQSGARKANEEALNAASKNIGTAIHMIAILEADLKLFEVTLDTINPSDLLIGFLSDFLQLPNSYLKSNADIKFQNFILRYGTHYVKSAKFGGELRITKTSKKESSLNSDEFASQAQSEFAGMMGVLKSSYEQKQSGFSFLGIGTKYNKNSQKATNTQSQTAKAKVSQKNAGTQQGTRSEFIKTTIEVKGGDPEIAASITDFYTPKFGQLFTKWCNSIAQYQRPFEFTLGKISSILNMSPNSLFSGDAPNSACFKAGNLKKDSKNGLTYFETETTEVDRDNKKYKVKKRNYCKYGKSKEKFVEDLMQTRLVLERAENIYMAEGPFSTTNFDIPGGEAGCESEILEYKRPGMSRIKNWPTWKEMKMKEVKVVFSMRFNLPGIMNQDEFIIMFDDNLWYTKRPGTKYRLENSCPSSTEQNRLCVAQLPLIYDENRGLLYLDADKSKNTYLWLNGALASVKSLEPIDQMSKSIGYLGNVPCSIKWINTHKVPIHEKGSCVYFQASSKGSIYLVFSGVPDDYDSWYYIQMTPRGVIFYQGMKIVKTDKSRLAATLGAETLFTGFFVCITAAKNGLRIDYGKAPEESEVGIVLTSHTFSKYTKYSVVYFTFGAGENKISINDVRIVEERPKIKCREGLKLVNNVCEMECDTQCNGCHSKNDYKSCIECKNKKAYLSQKIFACVEKCPEGSESKGNICFCSKGAFVEKKSKIQCEDCKEGEEAKNGICKDKDECLSNPCQNGGTCINLKNKFFCQCKSKHSGKFCHLGHRCKKNPCYNGAACVEVVDGFSCKCLPNFHKKLCDESINLAKNRPVTTNTAGEVIKEYTDGVRFQNPNKPTCKVTKSPDVTISLSKSFQIGSIRLWNGYSGSEKGLFIYNFPLRITVLEKDKAVGYCGAGYNPQPEDSPKYRSGDRSIRISCGDNGIKGDAIKLTRLNEVASIFLACEVEVFLVEEKRKECFTDSKGKDYRGALSTTTFGQPCQDWIKNSKYTPSSKPLAGLDENYCRNPSSGERPWCYIMGKQWQYCGISKC